jgi:hypothetical protein
VHLRPCTCRLASPAAKYPFEHGQLGCEFGVRETERDPLCLETRRHILQQAASIAMSVVRSHIWEAKRGAAIREYGALESTPVAFLSCFEQVDILACRYSEKMAQTTLADFIHNHRDDLIGRCRARLATRSSPTPTDVEIARGVPLLLSQLETELGHHVPNTDDLSDTAREHGRDLLRGGFTLDQVVRGYGDVCQSITELAVETDTRISAEDFRTLNQCLDDAIAGAVTAFAQGEDTSRDGELSELWSLVNSASIAFDALQAGTVGMRGATSEVVRRTLADLRAYVDRAAMTRSRKGEKDSVAATPDAPIGGPKKPPK